MNFSAALSAIKRGLPLTRDNERWSDKVNGCRYYLKKSKNENRILRAHVDKDGDTIYLSYILSGDDLFAEDWMIYTDIL